MESKIAIRNKLHEKIRQIRSIFSNFRLFMIKFKTTIQRSDSEFLIGLQYVKKEKQYNFEIQN